MNSDLPSTVFTSNPNKPSAVDTIINLLLDDVITGKYKPGDKLPTELQLAEIYNVSKNTVREAVKILIAYGIVEIRRPEGTFITDGMSPKVMNPIIYNAIIRSKDTSDITGLRRMIDTGIFMLLIQQGLDPADKFNLEEEFKVFSSLVLSENPDLSEVAAEDENFHMMLVRATKNELVTAIHDFVLELTRTSRKRTIQKVYESNDMEYLVKSHRMTLDVVEQNGEISLIDTIEFTYQYWKESYKL